jgi:hypothetical protein
MTEERKAVNRFVREVVDKWERIGSFHFQALWILRRLNTGLPWKLQDASLVDECVNRIRKQFADANFLGRNSEKVRLIPRSMPTSEQTSGQKFKAVKRYDKGQVIAKELSAAAAQATSSSSMSDRLLLMNPELLQVRDPALRVHAQSLRHLSIRRLLWFRGVSFSSGQQVERHVKICLRGWQSYCMIYYSGGRPAVKRIKLTTAAVKIMVRQLPLRQKARWMERRLLLLRRAKSQKMLLGCTMRIALLINS